MEYLPTNLTNLEEPCVICLITKSDIVIRVITIDASTFYPTFMNKILFALYKVEIISVITSTFVEICSYTS